MYLRFLIAMVIPLLFCGAAPEARREAAWPAWRGADRTGCSTETGLLDQWPEDGPQLLWEIQGLGEGFSTPSVTHRAIFTMGNYDEMEWVVALDPRKKGKQLWQTATGPVRHGGGGYAGPRSTPTVDGNRVYALGLNGDLLCLNARNGNILWRRNLVSDTDGTIPNWGYSESVLIDGPWALCTPGGENATIVALNKANGDIVWRSPVGDGAAYSSIIRAKLAGKSQYVQFTARGVIGVAANDGEFLWRYDAPANGTANCSTPVWSGDSIFAASGYGTGGGRVRIERSGKGFSAVEAYFSKKMKNHHGGTLIVDGYLYGSSDPGLLSCLDFETGDVQWRDRSCGKGSLLYADGMLYVRSEKGAVSLVEATPEEFRLRGQFEQPSRSEQPSWPYPVVAGGRLYLRDQDVLLCYDVRERRRRSR